MNLHCRYVQLHGATPGGQQVAVRVAAARARRAARADTTPTELGADHLHTKGATLAQLSVPSSLSVKMVRTWLEGRGVLDEKADRSWVAVRNRANPDSDAAAFAQLDASPDTTRYLAGVITKSQLLTTCENVNDAQVGRWVKARYPETPKRWRSAARSPSCASPWWFSKPVSSLAGQPGAAHVESAEAGAGRAVHEPRTQPGLDLVHR